MRRLNQTMISDTHAFAECDLDGNQNLDFEEFLALQPRVVRENFSTEHIRKWFDAADTSGDAKVSVNEFFVSDSTLLVPSPLYLPYAPPFRAFRLFLDIVCAREWRGARDLRWRLRILSAVCAHDCADSVSPPSLHMCSDVVTCKGGPADGRQCAGSSAA